MIYCLFITLLLLQSLYVVDFKTAIAFSNCVISPAFPGEVDMCDPHLEVCKSLARPSFSRMLSWTVCIRADVSVKNLCARRTNLEFIPRTLSRLCYIAAEFLSSAQFQRQKQAKKLILYSFRHG